MLLLSNHTSTECTAPGVRFSEPAAILAFSEMRMPEIKKQGTQESAPGAHPGASTFFKWFHYHLLIRGSRLTALIGALLLSHAPRSATYLRDQRPTMLRRSYAVRQIRQYPTEGGGNRH